MPYVTGGQVQQSPPFTHRVYKFFDNVMNFFMHFFRTLIPIEMNSQSTTRGGSRGSGGGSWGSGGPSGPRGGGGFGGGRFRTMGDINPPTVNGCAGGACGM